MCQVFLYFDHNDGFVDSVSREGPYFICFHIRNMTMDLWTLFPVCNCVSITFTFGS